MLHELYLNDFDDVPGTKYCGVELDAAFVCGESHHCLGHTIDTQQCSFYRVDT